MEPSQAGSCADENACKLDELSCRLARFVNAGLRYEPSSVRRLTSSRPGRVKALEQIVCVLINLCESGFKSQDVRTLARGHPQTRGLEDRVASRDHGIVEQHGPGFRAESWRVGVALEFLRLRVERARPEPICVDFLHPSFGH
jgi:hypothetical protein